MDLVEEVAEAASLLGALALAFALLAVVLVVALVLGRAEDVLALRVLVLVCVSWSASVPGEAMDEEDVHKADTCVPCVEAFQVAFHRVRDTEDNIP